MRGIRRPRPEGPSRDRPRRRRCCPPLGRAGERNERLKVSVATREGEENALRDVCRVHLSGKSFVAVKAKAVAGLDEVTRAGSRRPGEVLEDARPAPDNVVSLAGRGR